MSRFFKIVLKADSGVGRSRRKTVYLNGVHTATGWFYGRTVDPKTLEDKSFTDKQGVIHDIKDAIHPDAVEKWTEMYEDLFYGGLTTTTREEQLKKRGE